MKLAEMDALIKEGSVGFRVQYEVRERGILSSHVVPETFEKPFPQMEVARDYAFKMSLTLPPEYINICVIDAYTFKPCEEYKERMLRRYP